MERGKEPGTVILSPTEVPIVQEAADALGSAEGYALGYYLDSNGPGSQLLSAELSETAIRALTVAEKSDPVPALREQAGVILRDYLGPIISDVKRQGHQAQQARAESC